MVSEYCESSLAKEAIQTGFSPLIESRQERLAFLPPQDSTRPHFSEKPVAFVDCGYHTSDAGSTSNVSYEPTNAARYAVSAAIVKSNWPADLNLNPLLSEFPKSHRHVNGNLTYKVAVPTKGRYDITLLFATIHPSFLGVQKNVFTVEVAGVKTHVRTDLDVFAEVGGFRPYLISFSNVEVDDILEIRLLRGPYGTHTFINGFVVVHSGEKANSIMPEGIVTGYDCGGDNPKYCPPHVTSRPIVTYTGSRYKSPVTCESALAAGFTRISRHIPAGKTFGYDVAVPEPGRYDVSVCLSEVHEALPDVRIFDLDVQGLDVFSKKNVDVSSVVGFSHPYILSCLNMRVDDVVKVRVRGIKREPVISGIAVTKATPFPTDPAEDPLLITTVNCGSGGAYPERDTGLRQSGEYTGTVSTYHAAGFPKYGVVGEDEMFRLMGMSHRAADEVTYKFRARTLGLGTYDVAVVLCEVQNTMLAVGKRVFSLEVKGSTVQKIDGIDIFKKVGGYRTLVLRFPAVELEGGEFVTITAKKISGVGKAILNGIMIAPSVAKHPLMEEPPAPVALINSAPLGAPATLIGGAGENVTAKHLKKVSRIAVSGTGLLADICSRNCHGTFDYTIGLEAPGKYDVFVFFCEWFFTSAGKRVFNVEVTGKEKVEVPNIDIFAEVGMYVPLVVQVRDLEAEDVITLKGVSKTDFPMLCGFAVYEAGTALETTMPTFFVNELYDEDQDC